MLAVALGLAIFPLSALAANVVSEKTVTGFKFPESVAYDPEAKVLYVGSFGGTELKPAEKDNNGYISKVSLDGKILEERFLPAPGVTMHKPKGIWVAGNRLWVTDIDGVWEFDTRTKKGKKLDLPGVQFANDPAILGNTLYVSDNRTDMLVTVTPADFLDMNANPSVAVAWKDKGINPNGLYPSRDGALLMVGFKSDKEKRGIYSMKPGQDPKALSKEIGRLDGLYEMNDGTLLVTDWDSGTVFTWSEKAGMTTIASGFKGPADLCAFPQDGRLMVVVPDLVKSELRMLVLGN
jgi:sugar lactone lactonase YvrE